MVEIIHNVELTRQPDPEGRVMAVADIAKEAVKRGNWKKFWHFARNAALNKVRYDQMGTAAMVTGLAVSGVVVIVSLATGPIGIGILAGIAGGTYVLKKIITRAKPRRNRDWLKNCGKAESTSAVDWSQALASDAKDSIRRAVDHFRKAEEFARQLQTECMDGFGTCNDVITKVRLLADFIHESDKTRNYLLPICDLLILTIVQYIDLAQAWNANSIIIDNAAVTFMYESDHAGCKECHKDDRVYINPLYSGGGGGTDATTVDVGKVKRFIEDLAMEMEKAMRGHIREQATVAGAAGATEGRASDKRLAMLYEAIYRNANKAKALHKFRNAYTRSTASEKAFGLISELFSVGGSVGGLFVGDSQAICSVVKGVIKGGIASIQVGTDLAGDKVNSVKLTNRNKLMMESLAGRDSSGDIKDEGVAVQDLVKKLANHYKRAADAYGDMMNGLGSSLVMDSCETVIGIYTRIYEFLHYMDKMEHDLVLILSVVTHLTERSAVWSTLEAEAWLAMEDAVTRWIRNPLVHEDCVKNNTYCYGPKHNYRVEGGGMFRRGTKVFSGYDHWIPEKPL